MLFFKCHFNSVLNMYAYPHMYVLFDCKQEQREWFRSDFVLNIRYVTTVSGRFKADLFTDSQVFALSLTAMTK